MGKLDETKAFPENDVRDGSQEVPGESESREISGTVSEVNALAAEATEGSVEMQRIDATVLIVDDDDLVRRPLSKIIRHFGGRCITARNGVEAIRVIKSLPSAIDIVIADVVMPVMDGCELLSAIRKIDPKILIILTTGYLIHQIRDQEAVKKADYVLEKPIVMKNLYDTISGLLKGRSQK